MRAQDLNQRFKEMVGHDYNVKDLRTWRGTVLAARGFVDADPPISKNVTKCAEVAVVEEVADALGNTPAVARGSQIDPRVLHAYRQGLTIAAVAELAASCADIDEKQCIVERDTRRLIRRIDRGRPHRGRPHRV